MQRNKDAFKLYAKSLGDPSGCLYYRLQVPAKSLFKLGLGEAFIDMGKQSGDDAIQAMFQSDVIVDYALTGPNMESVLNIVGNMKPGWNEERTEMLFPPSVIFDIDDRIDCLHPFNPAFVHLGVRSPDGQKLKTGDRIVTTFPDGSEIVVWEDGVTRQDNQTFDVDRNWRKVEAVFDVARKCDGVTVPSLGLQKFYRDEVGCKEVYVFPNSIVPEDYPKPELAPRTDGSVRILWQGGASHLVDWFPLRDAVSIIAKKYPQVKFVIWGTEFKWVHDNIPEDQLELRPWLPYDAYKPMRTIIDADINLCPLVDNIFNRGKSAIKWYEGVMPFRPEATLAGNVPPYSEEMTDGVNGLLYNDPKEFIDKLSLLIENAELRRTLAENARQWVMDNRHYSKTVPGLFDFYQHIRAQKRLALTA